MDKCEQTVSFCEAGDEIRQSLTRIDSPRLEHFGADCILVMTSKSEASQ